MSKNMMVMIAAGCLVWCMQTVCQQIAHEVSCNNFFDETTRLFFGRSPREIFSENVAQEMAEKQLEKAIESSNELLLTALLEQGIFDVENSTDEKISYMLCACEVSTFAIIKLLLGADIDINIRDEYFFDVPLIVAARSRRIAIMRALAWHGAHAHGVFSSEWRAMPVHRYEQDSMAALMPEAERIECLRTQKIRLILERDWNIPKSISRLILWMSDTKWFACGELDVLVS